MDNCFTGNDCHDNTIKNTYDIQKAKPISIIVESVSKENMSSSLPPSISLPSEDISESIKSIKGNLTISKNTRGIVLFAHGSGSGRNSPRNQLIAHTLHSVGIGTLLIDLITESEEKVDLQTREFRFNIPLLINRLVTAIDYVKQYRDTKNLDIGIFGASTGAAAALGAIEKRRNIVKTAVFRGGRVDLAYKYCSIKQITAPVLLLVGENDPSTLKINEKLFKDLKSLKSDRKKITVIPGASHLFEEQGKIEQVSRLAASWFKKYL